MATRYPNYEESTSEEDRKYDNTLDKAEYFESLNADNCITDTLKSDQSLVLEESVICDSDEWGPITGKASILLFMSSEKMLITLNDSSIDNKVTPIELYHAIVTDDIMDLIAIETKSYVKNYKAKFREIIKLDMRKFLGLVNYMGNVRLPMISLYLSQNPQYNLPLPRGIMRRDRFLSLLRNFHASDNDSFEPGKLINIQHSWMN